MNQPSDPFEIADRQDDEFGDRHLDCSCSRGGAAANCECRDDRDHEERHAFRDWNPAESSHDE